MKKVLIIGLVSILGVFFSACSSKKISKVEAKQILRESIPEDVAEIEVVGNDLKIVFKNKVFFDSGKSQIKYEAQTSLYTVIEVYMGQILPAYPNSNIIVEGHADSDGKREYNLKLSEKRARAVVSYLSSEILLVYINKEKLSSVGYGEDIPRVPNISEENKAKNRRVELIFQGMKN